MSQEKGNASEIEFIFKAIRKGLRVSRPMFVEKYDCIVDNGKNVYKVQIKSTSHWNKSYYQLSLRHGCTQKEMYKKDDCDFFAVNVQKVNVWYIIPFSAVSPKLCLHPDSDSCRYDRYKEAWYLLYANTDEQSTSETLKPERPPELHP